MMKTNHRCSSVGAMMVWAMILLVLPFHVMGFHSNIYTTKTKSIVHQRLPSTRLSRHLSAAKEPAYQRSAVNKQDLVIVPDIFDSYAKRYPDLVAVSDPVHEGEVELTYKQLNERIIDAAKSFDALGVNPADCVSIFSENSHRWLITEQAVMKIGACNAVRGATAPSDELRYIYEDSNSIGIVVESAATLARLYHNEQGGRALWGEAIPPRFIIVLYSGGKSGRQLTEDLMNAKKKELHHSDTATTSASGIEGTAVYSFEEFLQLPQQLGVASNAAENVWQRDSTSAATVIYTSGTTAKPKGAVLSHDNLLYQVKNNNFYSDGDGYYNPQLNDTFLSLLPCWHVFERTAEYYCLSRGTRLVYSSLRSFKQDLVTKRPHILIAVPRLYENIYKSTQAQFRKAKGIKAKIVQFANIVTGRFKHAQRIWRKLSLGKHQPSPLHRLVTGLQMILLFPFYKIADRLVWKKVRDGGLGGRVKVMVSGGSLMSPHLEDFYDKAGLNLLVGYGLTETSPVICNQRVDSKLPGTIGRTLPGTQVKVVPFDIHDDSHNNEAEVVSEGETGVLMVKGPGVFSGYLNKEQATRAAFDKDGYFNTGDLVSINPSTNDIIMKGRAKETIVLFNGENVAPQPIEEKFVATSSLIDQAMLVGQDKKTLSAVLVLSLEGLLEHQLIDSSYKHQLQAALDVVATEEDEDDVEGQDKLKEARIQLKQAMHHLTQDRAVRAVLAADIDKVSGSFKRWEKVTDFLCIVEPFSMSNQQLTQTLKIKRHVIAQAYEEEIDQLSLRTKAATNVEGLKADTAESNSPLQAAKDVVAK